MKARKRNRRELDQDCWRRARAPRKPRLQPRSRRIILSLSLFAILTMPDMTSSERSALEEEYLRLREEHRDLDAVIEALLAVAVLALNDSALAERLDAFRDRQTASVAERPVDADPAGA